jgi:hypothetical protein
MKNLIFIFKKIFNLYILKRIFVERLTEPLHLNIISIFVLIFGSFRAKIDFDLILRCQHAYALLHAAEYAKNLGLKSITVIEFGVASGAGLLNISDISRGIYKITGIEFNIIGFDTGGGMPPPKSYRDHPDLYAKGDFPMDIDELKRRLPSNVKIVIGDISSTIKEFLCNITAESPIAFVSIDVDYYSSTKDALLLFDGEPHLYLPRVQIYLDDLEDMAHNSWCGELLAVNEFNSTREMRKIERHKFLRGYRVFKNARWIDHMFQLHVLDNKIRCQISEHKIRAPIVLSNPYLK